MKAIITFLCCFNIFSLFSQTIISGKILNSKKQPIEGVNVFLEGTYDGASTITDGTFSFTTEEIGEQTLKASFMSYQTYELKGDVTTFKNLTIILKEEIFELTGVTLSAGTFKAGDNSKISVLKPLDILTTASAVGDVFGAFQTLPGTTTVAEDGRLFVRGGDAEETQVFIDGLRVFSPYSSRPNNTPTRGRYSANLFKGTTFSTGGYSAEFGQALSSVFLLNTIDKPSQEETNISIMTLGAGIGNTQLWGNNSLSVNMSYINLKPYESLISDRYNWKKQYESFSGEGVYRKQFKNGLLKLYTAIDASNFDVYVDDINYEYQVQNKIKNTNLYTNLFYKGVLQNDWVIETGGSFSYTKNDIVYAVENIDQDELDFHAKLKLKRSFNSNIKLSVGSEYFSENFDEDYQNENSTIFTSKVENNLPSVFAESDIFFSNKLALNVGVRSSYTSVNKDWFTSPRISFAYKTGENDQFSLAYGTFYQSPKTGYLKYNNNLKSEKASHYLLNYQYIVNGKTFRAEAFYKKYDDLVKYNTQSPEYNSIYTNSGNGYASGFDVFWRDNKSVDNLEYWVSYSFLNTKRNYKNYAEKVTPNFTAKHNFSLVGKYWVDALKSQFGFTYSYTSGRPYDNPNTTDFMTEKTKAYHNVSFNCSYLLTQQKILYFSLSNPFGIKNINGYQYANQPDQSGFYNRKAIKPAADFSFFIGFFWTISDDKKSNQLDNL